MDEAATFVPEAGDWTLFDIEKAGDLRCLWRRDSADITMEPLEPGAPLQRASIMMPGAGVNRAQLMRHASIIATNPAELMDAMLPPQQPGSPRGLAQARFCAPHIDLSTVLRQCCGAQGCAHELFATRTTAPRSRRRRSRRRRCSHLLPPVLGSACLPAGGRLPGCGPCCRPRAC